jgi:hypothetical protein
MNTEDTPQLLHSVYFEEMEYTEEDARYLECCRYGLQAFDAEPAVLRAEINAAC